MKKIIPVTICFLIASLSLSSCGKEKAEDTARQQAEGDTGKVLVAFFSYGGNTRKLAENAAREMEQNARPALTTHVENMEEYDVVLLGFPIWWGSMPMAVNTFLEEYDFEGKIIAPFCTHGGSGLGSSVTDIEKLCPDAETADGLAVYGSRADQAGEQVAEWLEKLGLYGENQDREEEIQE